ncbi:MAG TPA: YccF domain-containing protein [Caulobacteraceae bacterium]|nr:YccF domain-containing protein [Caulobacteraceae bacterium]
MKLLLNILWFVFGGWISLLAWLLAGVVLACTVVGLPWAFAAFRIAGFSAAPFGRQVLPRNAVDGSGGSGLLDGLLNVVWFIFAGWWLALQHLVLAILLICSVVGIPFGLQHLKLAGFSLAPVGTRVVET